MIELKELSKQVALVAARHPKSWNRESLYFLADGAPCCLIGHGLADLRATYESVSDVNTRTIAFIYLHSPDFDNNRYLNYLTVVQGLTDEGMQWLPAVIQASRVLLDTKE